MVVIDPGKPESQEIELVWKNQGDLQKKNQRSLRKASDPGNVKIRLHEHYENVFIID